MPIIVKDYSWRQTDSTVVINVPCKKELSKNVDFISSECYIKASYAPYIFEIFLAKNVKDSESSCIKGDDELVFTLIKEDEGEWETLEKKLTKEEKKEQRFIILKNIEMKYEFLAKENSERKTNLHRKAVRQQINIDEVNRKKIEEIKDNERKKLAKELTYWKQTPNCTMEGKKSALVRKEKGTEGKQVFTVNNLKKGKKEEQVKVLEPPAPRSIASIQVTFSPRFFPTPSRESTAVEEEEWLQKQAEARRMVGFDDSDLSLEEKDPMWLKEKGDSFFKIGNYHGAVAAYTHGIKLSGKMPALYSNRATAHIALGNFFKAAEDSSMALELITPHTPSNALTRARCHSKRGAAFWKLGLLDKALVELHGAHNLLKFCDTEKNYLASLEKDIETLKLKMENSSENDDSNDEGLHV